MNIRNSLRSQNGMLHSDALLIRISATGISNFTIIKVTKTYNFLLTGQHLGHIAILLTFLALSSQHFGHIAILLTFSALASQHFAHLVVLLTFLAPSGQHFKYIAVLLTFLAPSGQHFGHIAVLLTFLRLPISILDIWLFC